MYVNVNKIVSIFTCTFVLLITIIKVSTKAKKKVKEEIETYDLLLSVSFYGVMISNTYVRTHLKITNSNQQNTNCSSVCIFLTSFFSFTLVRRLPFGLFLPQKDIFAIETNNSCVHRTERHFTLHIQLWIASLSHTISCPGLICADYIPK